MLLTVSFVFIILTAPLSTLSALNRTGNLERSIFHTRRYNLNAIPFTLRMNERRYNVGLS